MYSTTEITRYDDIIDSRGVIERITEIENFLEEDDEISGDDKEHYETELQTLKALAIEGANSTDDWNYGATLIHENYFEEYAREFAEDVYDLSRMGGDLASYIDWEKFADDLKSDYNELTFDGQIFYTR